ncbi:hypothetical protein [Actinokineospora globicatena]|uniref:hypothetical protein n=1 Tax=Actinokineospora globicatena TaxID=103729 RepID=UPI0020A472EB|nr:hypothetical protein [Actinokineospora globicatena]
MDKTSRVDGTSRVGGAEVTVRCEVDPACSVTFTERRVVAEPYIGDVVRYVVHVRGAAMDARLHVFLSADG